MTRSMIGFAGRINSIHLKQLIYRSSALIFIGTRGPAWGARRECAAPCEPTAPVVGMPRHNAKLTNKTAISFRLIFLEYRFAVTTAAAPLNLKHILWQINGDCCNLQWSNSSTQVVGCHFRCGTSDAITGGGVHSIDSRRIRPTSERYISSSFVDQLKPRYRHSSPEQLAAYSSRSPTVLRAFTTEKYMEIARRCQIERFVTPSPKTAKFYEKKCCQVASKYSGTKWNDCGMRRSLTMFRVPGDAGPLLPIKNRNAAPLPALDHHEHRHPRPPNHHGATSAPPSRPRDTARQTTWRRVTARNRCRGG